MSTYQTKGIILKRTDRGEADQLFSIYTETHGKISAIARGAKKISSKLNGHLQFFTIAQLMIAPGKRYDHVAGVQIDTHFSQISRDLKKIVLASFALELVEKMTQLGQADRRIFDLCITYFSAVNTCEFSQSDWQLIRHAFVIKLLTLLGFAPPPEIADSEQQLHRFLQEHVDRELMSDKFLYRIRPLTNNS